MSLNQRTRLFKSFLNDDKNIAKNEKEISSIYPKKTAKKKNQGRYKGKKTSKFYWVFF